MDDNRKRPFPADKFYPRASRAKSGSDIEGLPALENVVSLIEKSPSIAPPPNFTMHVMNRLAESAAQGRQIPAARPLGMRLKPLIDRMTIPASANEAATCFFLAGFFYLVLGIILHVGLTSLVPPPSPNGWVYYQPFVAGLTFIGFSIIGWLLLNNRRLAVRIANLAVPGCVLLSVAGGALLSIARTSPLSLVITICFTTGTAALNIFLVYMINNLNHWVSASPSGEP